MRNNKIFLFLLLVFGISYSQEKLCFGEDAKAVINASLVVDNTYEVNYNLTGANTVLNAKVSVQFVNGTATIIIPSQYFKYSGTTTLTVVGMKNSSTACYSLFPQSLTKDFRIKEYINLNLAKDYTFCNDKKKKLVDLTSLTEWFDSNKNPISSNELLQTGIYYYKDINEDGCLGSTYNSITVNIESCEIMIPNAFTPNGDNWNDTFNILNVPDKYPNYEMMISNRHGMQVYKGKNGWNGTLNNKGGEVLENGIYYMWLDYKDASMTNTKHTILLQK